MPNPKDSKFRIFLRQVPQPVRVRARKGDEEQDIALADQVRHRWRIAEEACTSWGAETVECLDAKGAITRSFTLIDSEDAGRDRERSAKMFCQTSASSDSADIAQSELIPPIPTTDL